MRLMMPWSRGWNTRFRHVLGERIEDMIRIRWYKVISDLWSHRTRTLIVSLAVAVGVYAVGTIMAAQTLMLREFHSEDRKSVV